MHKLKRYKSESTILQEFLARSLSNNTKGGFVSIQTIKLFELESFFRNYGCKMFGRFWNMN